MQWESAERETGVKKVDKSRTAVEKLPPGALFNFFGLLLFHEFLQALITLRTQIVLNFTGVLPGNRIRDPEKEQEIRQQAVAVVHVGGQLPPGLGKVQHAVGVGGNHAALAQMAPWPR